MGVERLRLILLILTSRIIVLTILKVISSGHGWHCTGILSAVTGLRHTIRSSSGVFAETKVGGDPPRYLH